MEHPGAVGRIFNIGNTEEVSILELARRVIQLTGSDSTIKLIPYEEAYEVGFEDMARRIPDISRVQALIGYQPRVGLDEIITRIAEHFRETATTESVAVGTP
jgi:UDP-glucose 4-epimerase